MGTCSVPELVCHDAAQDDEDGGHPPTRSFQNCLLKFARRQIQAAHSTSAKAAQMKVLIERSPTNLLQLLNHSNLLCPLYSTHEL